VCVISLFLLCCGMATTDGAHVRDDFWGGVGWTSINHVPGIA